MVVNQSSETSLNIFFSHRTSTSSAFKVITETRYINYLLTYLMEVSGVQPNAPRGYEQFGLSCQDTQNKNDWILSIKALATI